MSDTPPPVPNTGTQSAPSYKDLMRFEGEKKSAGVALLLCWLIGMFGVHRFYLGRPHAVTMLIISLVSIPLCLIFVGFVGLFAMLIWWVCDLFQVPRWAKEYNAASLARIQLGQ